MTSTIIFALSALFAIASGITAILARDQISEAKLKEEVGLAELVGRDPRRLPNRVFTPKGVRMKQASIICAVLAIAALVAYALLR